MTCIGIKKKRKEKWCPIYEIINDDTQMF